MAAFGWDGFSWASVFESDKTPSINENHLMPQW